MSEADYVAGGKAVWRTLLDLAIRGLGSEEQDKHGWRKERAAAVAALRRICDRHGDNDWPDEAHLGDVLTKHLEDHLEAP